MANKAEAEKKSKLFTDEGTYTEGPLKGLRWGEVSYDGVTYRVRQNTVQEGDDAYDAAYDEKTQRFNNRFNSRMNLAQAIVSPETSIDDMGAWSGMKLVFLLRAWDEHYLLKDADTSGNA